jgi:cytochrome c5
VYRHALAALSVMLFSAASHAVPAGTEKEILERIKPVGELCVEGQGCAGKLETAVEATPPEPATAEPGALPEADTSPEPTTVADAAPPSGRSGEEVYSRYCFACHAAGVAGAPLFGDAAQWEPRIAKGMDALLQSSINGVPPLMPPKGTCMDCTEAELGAAVEYMVEAAE